MKYFFTSESVTEGHPDKICDIISDRFLDEALSKDRNSRMAVECTIKDNFILVYGEANTQADIDYKQIAKQTLKKIGYKEEYTVKIKVSNQSHEISNAVLQDNGIIGAGDQGIMFGYACNDTENVMPFPIEYANKLARQLAKIQRENKLLGPDGKTQVTVEYENNHVKRIDSIVISTQHSNLISLEEIKKIIIEKVINVVIPNKYIDSYTKYYINPSGSFTIGGSFGDSGTTGRKIVADTYGGFGRIGGGCLSSKDPTKVDRSATYYARYVAKNIVANGYATKCEIQLSYVIGKSNPVSIYIDTFGTNTIDMIELEKRVKDTFDFSLTNIIKELDLLKPIYHLTSCYGHFGKINLPWEKIINF